MATQLHLANKVQYLRGITFSQLTHNEKISIKTIGRPTPKLFIEQKSKARNGIYTRHFNDKVYDENDWICGCEEKKTIFLLPRWSGTKFSVPGQFWPEIFFGQISWLEFISSHSKHLLEENMFLVFTHFYLLHSIKCVKLFFLIFVRFS